MVDNDNCACAVVGRIEVCWTPHGRFREAVAQATDTPNTPYFRFVLVSSMEIFWLAGWRAAICTTRMCRACVIVRIIRAEPELRTIWMACFFHSSPCIIRITHSQARYFIPRLSSNEWSNGEHSLPINSCSPSLHLWRDRGSRVGNEAAASATLVDRMQATL